MTQGSDVVGYQRFGEPRCLLLQGEVNDGGKEDIDVDREAA